MHHLDVKTPTRPANSQSTSTKVSPTKQKLMDQAGMGLTTPDSDDNLTKDSDNCTPTLKSPSPRGSGRLSPHLRAMQESSKYSGESDMVLKFLNGRTSPVVRKPEPMQHAVKVTSLPLGYCFTPNSNSNDNSNNTNGADPLSEDCPKEEVQASEKDVPSSDTLPSLQAQQRHPISSPLRSNDTTSVEFTPGKEKKKKKKKKAGDSTEKEKEKKEDQKKKETETPAVAQEENKADVPIVMTKKVFKRVPEDANSGKLKRINQYKVQKQLGKGGCAVVWLAKENKLSASNEKLFAIKGVLRPKHALGAGIAKVKALKQEASILNKLRHPNVVRAWELIDDEQDPMIYLVEDFIPGKPVVSLELKDGVAEAVTPLPSDRLYRLMYQLLAGLDYMHARHIVHRDIKPDNLLVTEDDRLFICDFGISDDYEDKQKQMDEYFAKARKLLNESMQASLRASSLDCFSGRFQGPTVFGKAGTILFMAPELGEEERNSFNGWALDMWAVGVTFYILLTGRYPFMTSTDREKATYTPPEECEEEWRVLVKNLVVKDPKVRWTAKQAFDHLKKYEEKYKWGGLMANVHTELTAALVDQLEQNGRGEDIAQRQSTATSQLESCTRHSVWSPESEDVSIVDFNFLNDESIGKKRPLSFSVPTLAIGSEMKKNVPPETLLSLILPTDTLADDTRPTSNSNPASSKKIDTKSKGHSKTHSFKQSNVAGTNLNTNNNNNVSVSNSANRVPAANSDESVSNSTQNNHTLPIQNMCMTSPHSPTVAELNHDNSNNTTNTINNTSDTTQTNESVSDEYSDFLVDIIRHRHAIDLIPIDASSAKRNSHVIREKKDEEDEEGRKRAVLPRTQIDSELVDKKSKQQFCVEPAEAKKKKKKKSKQTQDIIKD